MPRFACTLVWGPGALALALALAPRAHAGPTSTDTGTTDTGTTDTGTTDTGTTGTGTTDTDATTTGTATTSGESSSGSSSDSATTRTTMADTGDCGICDESVGDIAFMSPGDGDEVSSPIEITVAVTPRCNCNGCACTEMPPMYTQLFLDSVAAGTPCYTLECAWSIDAALGQHSLYVSTAFTDDDMLGTRIDVRVTSIMTGTETGIGSDEEGPPASDTSTAPGSIGEDPPKGCGCVAPAERPHPGWHAGWLVLLAGVLRRRRARR